MTKPLDIYFIRHAESRKNCRNDLQRPITEAGKEAAAKIAHSYKIAFGPTNLAFRTTGVRSIQTARLFSQEGASPVPHCIPALYPENCSAFIEAFPRIGNAALRLYERNEPVGYADLMKWARNAASKLLEEIRVLDPHVIHPGPLKVSVFGHGTCLNAIALAVVEEIPADVPKIGIAMETISHVCLSHLDLIRLQISYNEKGWAESIKVEVLQHETEEATETVAA